MEIPFDLHVVNYSLSIRLEESGANKEKRRAQEHLGPGQGVAGRPPAARWGGASVSAKH